MIYFRMIIILLFINISGNLHSQLINMWMRIEWKEQNVYFLDYKGKTKVPFLRICYKNGSHDSLYFYEKNLDDAKYINFYDQEFINANYQGLIQSDSMNNLIRSKKEYGNRFNIFVGSSSKTSSHGWLLLKDNKVKLSKPNFCSDVSKKINNITSAFSIQNKLNVIDSTVQLHGFNYSDKRYISDNEAFDMIPEYKFMVFDSLISTTKAYNDSLKNDIYKKKTNQIEFDSNIKQIHNKFICLKPYGEYIKEYDLTPFLFVGGNYKFIYISRVLQYSEDFLNPFKLPKPKFPLSKNKHEDIYFNYVFPKEYLGYKLYKGEIKGGSTYLSIDK